MYAVSHIEAKPGIWCWAVAFRRRGKAYYKSFYDVGCGGSRKALAAAIAWRDRQLRRTKVLTRREFNELKRSNNRTGAVGVYFLRPPHQPQGVWLAKLTFPRGKQMTRSFSVRKYGHSDAFEHALAARRDMLSLIDDVPYLHSPVARAIAAQHKRKRKGSPSGTRAKTRRLTRMPGKVC